MGSSEHTLPEIARVLGEKEHRLIYLCERGVVVPDVEDARGRGSSRVFSKRNVLEFAVALKLREAMLPVTATAAVIQVLRAFERKLSREIADFSLPESLSGAKAPDLRVILRAGRRLYFSLGVKGTRSRIFGGIDIKRVRTSKAVSLQEANGPNSFETDSDVRVELNVTEVARNLAEVCT
jgi:hypothetical protein